MRFGAFLLCFGLLRDLPAAAQSYQPFPLPPAVNLSGGGGADGRSGSTGGDAGNGGSGQELLRELNFAGIGGGAAPAVSAISNGGKGGNGGRGGVGSSNGDGGNAGIGGAGGIVGVRLTAAGGITTTSSVAGLQLSASGGTGGNGGGIGNRGEGGESGSGGDGGQIALTTDAGNLIRTTSAGVPAVLLTANGGIGGGVAESNQLGGDVYGRRGGDGGTGGSITTMLSGAIDTLGSGVLGVAAGGKGGNGGLGASTLGKGIGGDGGNGGAGGSLLLFDFGTMSAVGAAAPGSGTVVTIDNAAVRLSVVGAGLLAESLGGTGGKGGVGQGGFGSGTGGAGGIAGGGGSVGVYQYGGSLTTQGYSEAGLFAQSVGGDGGNGANAAAVFSKTGGSGGPGGFGATATAIAEGAFVGTSGNASDAITAQSIGGGGGYGGDVELIAPIATIVIGGEGAKGGSAFNATARSGAPGTPSGVVFTQGDVSAGLLAQSVGGGGGIGGNATGVGLGVVTVAVGGQGGTGGDASAATATNYGTVQTNGAHSNAAMAQSIGGGGGGGGWGSSTTAGVQITAAASVGGNGGTGGTGANALAANLGQITTQGTDSYGELAQSVGGGGGESGDALARVLQIINDPKIPSVVVNVAIGGTNGNGGRAGEASVSNSGAVLTAGSAAAAMFAQSVGGGGGDGGDATSLNQSLQQPTIQVTVTAGGNGGTGGDGGLATATNSGVLLTLGEHSPGIAAQSVGGGGGQGGAADADTGSVKGQSGKSAQVTVTLGGRGGASGTGGDVQVTNAGGILTRGDAADGVIAQSVGGGGGLGGAGKALGSGGDLNVNVSLGGRGGKGGNGGNVTVTQQGSILTDGGAAPAILAQSIGGGGGNGGDAATGGGTSPTTTAGNFLKSGLGIGAATTDEGNGIFALAPSAIDALKSVTDLATTLAAYNRGNSGAVPPPGADSADTSLTVDVGAGFGGAGGSGGNGGAVKVTNTSTLQTDGPDSAAILAQSVGGGGGEGGAANPSAGGTLGTPTDTSASIGVGGAGKSSGAGGPVEITDNAPITTSGDLSFAIHGESVGGGGGDGGETIAQNAALGTLSVALGGKGGSSGNGGAVSVSIGASHAITTLGRDASGVLAQSIGGGGGLAALMGTSDPGLGGGGRSGTGLSDGSVIPNSTVVNLAIDGTGGASGAGGAVKVTLDPTAAAHGQGIVLTAGRDAYGVMAQSIGGGGGLVLGVPNSGTMLGSLYRGNASGSGGNVDVLLRNGYNIYTSGSGSAGIVAQSIGGGGGTVGELDLVNLAQGLHALPKTQGGQGGNVSVSLVDGGNIVTEGYRAHGILAQSLGGGGGVLDQSDGNGYAYASASRYTGCKNAACTGTVVVQLASNTVVRVLGAQTYGVLLESRGNGVNNTYLSVFQTAYIESWGQSAAAVFVAGADSNVISNYGVIDNGSLQGAPTPSGVAITGIYPASVNNSGTINGSIVLPPGSGITNAPGGTLNTGAAVTLGAGDTLTNDGVISPGGLQHVATTVLTGALVQDGEGTVAFDEVSATGQTDHLQVNGRAILAGHLEVAQDGPLDLLPHSTRSDVITATGGLSDGGLRVISSTPVVVYTLTNPDPNDLDLDTTVDFTAARAFGSSGLLSRDRGAIGTAFDTIEVDGPATLAPVADAVAIVPTAPALASTYDSLSGQAVVDAQQVSFAAQHQFDAAVLQQVDGEAGMAVGPMVPHRLGPEAWIIGFGGNDLLKSTGGAASVSVQSAGGAFGVADWFSDALMAGISVGGGNANFSVSGESRDSSDRSVNVALYGLARGGPFYASGLLGYGNDAVSQTRTGIGQLLGLDASASSQFSQNVVGGRVEVGRIWSRGAVDITPFAALEADGLWQGQVTERAPDDASAAQAAVALRTRSHADVSIPTTLGARADWRLLLVGGRALTPTLQLGWVHEFSSVRTLDAAFAGAPNVGFHVEGAEAARNAAQLVAGASLELTRAVSLVGTVTGQFANVETAVGGYAGVRATW